MPKGPSRRSASDINSVSPKLGRNEVQPQTAQSADCDAMLRRATGIVRIIDEPAFTGDDPIRDLID